MHPCYDNLENKKNARKRYSPPACHTGQRWAGSLRLHRRSPAASSAGPCGGSGIAIELPEGTAGFVFARSGLGIKHGIALANGVGVIDSDYTGEVCVGLINQFDEPYQIQPGERIAQLAVLPILCPVIEAVDTLTQTQRGAGGFGSTGR